MEHIHLVEVKIRVVWDIPVSGFVGEQQFGLQVRYFFELEEKVQVQVGIVGKGVFVLGRVEYRSFPVPAEAKDGLHAHGVFFQPERALVGQHQGMVVG